MKGLNRKQKEELRSLQLYPLGDSAVVLQFGEAIDDDTHSKLRTFAAYLKQHPFEGFIEFVPAFTTLTIYYNPWVVSEKGNYNPYERVIGIIEGMLAQARKNNEKQEPRVVEIPVCYGGEYGADLEFVAAYHQLSAEEVIEAHACADYTVYMIGFAPGFPYLGGLNEKIATPRRSKPRLAIPKGSVGIAGLQTGIYPIETPGGWQLIGRTPLSLFDARRESPSLLQAGDMVRFLPITREEFEDRKEPGL